MNESTTHLAKDKTIGEDEKVMLENIIELSAKISANRELDRVS